MPQVDLTRLNGPELRRLLNAVRERGQAQASYQILQEMAARRERLSAGLLRARRPAQPRLVAVDLDGSQDQIPDAAADAANPEDDIPPLPPGWTPTPPPQDVAPPRQSKRKPPPKSRARPSKPADKPVAREPIANAPAVTASAAVEEDDIPPLPPGWTPPTPADAAPAPEAKPALRKPQRTRPLAPKPKGEPAPRKRPGRRTQAPVGLVALEDPIADEPLTIGGAPPGSARSDEADTGPRPLTSFAYPAGPELPPPPPRRAPPRWPTWAGAGFVAGIMLGLASGWWAGAVVTGEAAHTPRAANTAARVAAARFVPARADGDVTADGPPSDSAPPAPASRSGAPSTPSAEDFAQDATQPAPPTDATPAAADAETAPKAETADTAEPAPANAVHIAKAPPAGCAAAPTAADRTICQNPHLQELQRQLRKAYAGALAAHEDRALLRQHQLAWREARNDVAEPAALAKLYEERIKKLNAAAADARRKR
jgi:uncharacterized protein YecT (DUF1311 family)